MSRPPLRDERHSIGELAKMTRTKAATIRYYERIGLMPEPARTSGNQRLFDERHVTRLAFIRHARELGFPLDAVRELLALAAHPDEPCKQADQIAARQLGAVRARIDRMLALATELERMLDGCRRGSIGDCRVMQILSDHALCVHENHGGSENLSPL